MVLPSALIIRDLLSPNGEMIPSSSSLPRSSGLVSTGWTKMVPPSDHPGSSEPEWRAMIHSSSSPPRSSGLVSTGWNKMVLPSDHPGSSEPGWRAMISSSSSPPRSSGWVRLGPDGERRILHQALHPGLQGDFVIKGPPRHRYLPKGHSRDRPCPWSLYLSV